MLIKYFKTLLEEILIRLPNNIQHFKALQLLSQNLCLNPERAKFLDLPFINEFIDNQDLYKVEVQYNMLPNVNWLTLYGKDVLFSSYKFWPVVANPKNAGGQLVFGELSQFVLTLLSLPISNATVERVFSIMNATKTKLRNKMGFTLLDSILRVKTYFYANKICCKDFNPSRQMYERFNNSIYNNEDHDTGNDNAIDKSEVWEIMDDTTEFPCISLPEY